MVRDNPPVMTALPTSLEDYKIKSLPASAFYIADFITQEEERILLEKVVQPPSTQR
jgi:alkylated DNA repair protein alkB family protein 6